MVKGVSEATKLLKKLKPDLVFSKGGFVAVPVVLGAKKNKIPVIIHESDITPGLANKIAMPFAKTVCTTFPETLKYVPKEKGIHTGTPIRAELFKGDRQKGLEICGFDGAKPVLLQMGGSLGAVKLNDALRESLPSLLKDFDIIHLCAKVIRKKVWKAQRDTVSLNMLPMNWQICLRRQMSSLLVQAATPFLNSWH